MERYYLPIDGKNLDIDVKSIEILFGCGGTVSDCFDHDTIKYAFYNTGHLCQVSYGKGSQWMKVECFAETSRREDILKWLQVYLKNGMEANGFGTEILNFNGYFFAHFYEKE